MSAFRAGHLGERRGPKQPARGTCRQPADAGSGGQPCRARLRGKRKETPAAKQNGEARARTSPDGKPYRRHNLRSGTQAEPVATLKQRGDDSAGLSHRQAIQR
ncbi:hypothetical protein MAFF301560_39400 (plasmid) [Ralstonia solanacearum]|nr:hypothetical protein MAFF301560_39400 [Ralstonia solanacearum]BEU48592.1 hypothetical protein MAFF211519_39170 [Ralstonia pseudosolanacearum]